MIHLLQLLRYLVNHGHDVNMFYELFKSLKLDAIDLDYIGNEAELFSDMMVTHYDIQLESDKQLTMMVAIILDNKKFKAAIETTKIFTV